MSNLTTWHIGITEAPNDDPPATCDHCQQTIPLGGLHWKRFSADGLTIERRCKKCEPNRPEDNR